MRFIVDITPDAVDKIQNQIRKGEYRTIQEFISTAIQNQIYLIEQPIEQTPEPLTIKTTPVTKDNQTSKENILGKIEDDIETVEANPQRHLDTLSGFWNKFFPVKITVRTLQNLIHNQSSPILLDELHESASREARKVGLSLVRSEKGSGRKRGDRLFTGLPVNKNSEKSRSRFKSHFVGEQRSNIVDGMPGTLRLLTIFSGQDGKDYVSLTPLGLEFSNIANPYLDNNNKNSVLSDEENGFLLRIISQNLPKEFEDMENILNLVKKGQNTTEDLYNSIREKKPDFSKNEVQTYLSGHLNRMTDLDLLIRKYVGLAYFYEVSEKGYKLITKNKPSIKGGS